MTLSEFCASAVGSWGNLSEPTSLDEASLPSVVGFCAYRQEI